ncbi:MAG: methyltransferase domain-containing protein, partial [Myxococcales bacterium]|nr:methyltransferase domain-containing protein [Myxococcales bacterium]
DASADASADANTDAPLDPNEPEFWDSMYRRGFTGWELGRPAPPLASYFAAHPPQGKRALVVGCGRGNEARMLADHGADVIAIDIAATAIAQAASLPSPRPIDFRVANVFDLRGQPPAYDLIVEHTCFCAIDPARRGDFVDAVRDALVPGGALVGLFFAHGRDGGPPFSVTADEVRARFADGFTVDRLERATDSVISRRGEELFARIVRD